MELKIYLDGEYVSKEKAKEMGIAGRKRVEELFSIEKHTRQIEEVYLSLLSS